jgi:hypothetical protein
MIDQTRPEPICSICGEPVTAAEDVVVTAASVLHVQCVEQSAAAA